MQFVVILLALLMLPAGAFSRNVNPSENDDEDKLTLLIDFQGIWEPVALKEMQRETDRLLKTVELGAEWVINRPGIVIHSGNVIVVRVFGDFSGHERSPERASSRGPLGMTLKTDGVFQPFIHLYSCRIRNLMDLGGFDGYTRDSLFGRGSAKVLAHELYHLLTQTAEHTDFGLTKRAFTADDLTRIPLCFERDALQRFNRQANEPTGR